MTILAFLFVLGVLVFVHEFGHFFVARLYGVRVLTFSLGFGPKLLKITRGGTEYCVSAVPLGGYVKLAGESADEARKGEPDEFLSKSKWVRFQVYLAGPVMNILLALALMTGVLVQGADVPLYETSAPVIGSIAPGSAGEKAGLVIGDRITRIGSRDVATWNDLADAVAPLANREVPVAVMRDGHPMTVNVTPAGVSKYEVGTLGILPVIRPQVTTVTKNQPADRAGFQKGDVILAVNGEKGLSSLDITKKIHQSNGAPLIFTLERGTDVKDISVRTENGLIGVQIFTYETKRIDPTFMQAIGLSAQQNWESAATIGRTLKGLITTETSVKQLMGPVAIAQLSGEAAGLGPIELMRFMAMISLNLALLNLMPIPVFDGGHIAILAVESIYKRIFNRDLSMRVKEAILIGGAALVMLLMVTVIYNDVVRLMK